MYSARHRFGVGANRLYAFGVAALVSLVALSTGAPLQAQAAKLGIGSHVHVGGSMKRVDLYPNFFASEV